MNGELMTNCTPTSHVFAWQAHTPGGSIDYATPPGLRCQCGEREIVILDESHRASDDPLATPAGGEESEVMG
jgi:hypothetical protein